MADRVSTALSSILLVLILYISQGINLGLTFSIPLLLMARQGTWKDRGTFNFVSYPFSLKLFWAPLIDAIYNRRFGRRKSWLVPVQFSTAIIFFIVSFYIQSLLDNRAIIKLTIIFTVIVLLTATQDICVDGLAITLFIATNPQWASTSQTLGQTLGRMLGFSFMLTLESANFTNKFIREPLSIAPSTTGLITLGSFIRFTAIALFIVTILLLFFFHEREEESTTTTEPEERLPIFKTYLAVIEICKMKSVQKMCLISLVTPMGLVATNYMTSLSLVSQGIPKENLALASIPVTLVTMIAPLTIRHTKKPLHWFAGAYAGYLVSAVPTALFVYYTPYLAKERYYYVLLIVLSSINEFIIVLRFAAQIGFFASICDPRIGGTYMTFLVTVNNLGYALNSSVILYVADFLPKRYAYVIAVGFCFTMGCIWLAVFLRMILALQNLPINRWFLKEDYFDKNTKPLSNDSRGKEYEMELIVSGGAANLTGEAN